MKKINFIKYLISLIFLVGLLVLPYFVFAQTAPLNKLQEVGPAGGYSASTNEFTAAVLVGTVVKAFLGMLGIIFIILMVYAGYNWMIAHGDEQKVDKAKDTIREAIIGLVVTVGAYAIWNFVILRIIQ
jgi:hypothetical protein